MKRKEQGMREEKFFPHSPIRHSLKGHAFSSFVIPCSPFAVRYSLQEILMKSCLICAMLISLGFSTTSLAGPKDYVIYVTRLGGDSESARPYITKASAYFEAMMGWPKDSTHGIFLPELSEAVAFIQKNKPGFAILEPPLFMELRKTMELTPLVQLESKQLVSRRMHIVVLNPAWTSLDQIKGKRLWTTLTDSVTYLSKVVFGGKIDAPQHFQLKKVGHALKGVRAVLRGKADATLLDDDMLASAKKMKGGEKLRTLFTSGDLPPPSLVAFNGVMTPAEQKKLARVLIKMCGTKDGAPICKEIMITRFAPIETRLFQQAQRLFDAAK
jgi:hypothetical protein